MAKIAILAAGLALMASNVAVAATAQPGFPPAGSANAPVPHTNAWYKHQATHDPANILVALGWLTALALGFTAVITADNKPRPASP